MVQSFLHTQTINTQFTVIELLRDDGNLEQIRAYVVDKITTLAQVVVPDEIRLEYSQTTPWPAKREVLGRGRNFDWHGRTGHSPQTARDSGNSRSFPVKLFTNAHLRGLS